MPRRRSSRAEPQARRSGVLPQAREVATLGREVKIEEIQPCANQLLDANLIMRRGHGKYSITDPFVQEVWNDRQKTLLN